MKLCILDGDGVLWNNDARMEIAEQAAQIVKRTITHFGTTRGLMIDAKEDRQLVEGARWDVAFNPALIALDRHIPRNDATVSLLIAAGWRCVILTSNPESTRSVRDAWLIEHGLGLLPLYLKDTGDDSDPRDRYMPTPKWKALQVMHMLEKLCDTVSTLLFVDDQAKNRDAIQEAFGSNGEMSLIVTDSLDLAVSLLEGQSGSYFYPINPEG